MLNYLIFRRVNAHLVPVSQWRSVNTSEITKKVLLRIHSAPTHTQFSKCVHSILTSEFPSFSAMAEKNIFKLTDYDCIGFDLDNTLCSYNIEAMMRMEYATLSTYLVEKKGYDGKHLLKPVEDFNYIKKGLMLDFENGNVLQIGRDGSVLRACHGTKLLDDSEVGMYYGPDRKWSLAAEFCKDVVGSWNGPLSQKLRNVLDSFDMPASLVFARIIDTIDDNEGRRLEKYNVWGDVLDGLVFMFQRENFSADAGGYFPSMKGAPAQYINRCGDNVLSWLKLLKKQKKTFLITGSNADFASFVAENCLGEHWLEYFDIVICYARKPGFFISSRPFLALDSFKETVSVSAKDLKVNSVYSQGNWKELLQFFSQITRKENPKCVYIGDNLIQDVYVPSKYTDLDTVAVVDNMLEKEEISADGGKCEVQTSGPWTSYFGSGQQGISIWSDIVCTYSKICVPSIDVLAERAIDHKWLSFSKKDDNCKTQGFHPNCPVNIL